MLLRERSGSEDANEMGHTSVRNADTKLTVPFRKDNVNKLSTSTKRTDTIVDEKNGSQSGKQSSDLELEVTEYNAYLADGTENTNSNTRSSEERNKSNGENADISFEEKLVTKTIVYASKETMNSKQNINYTVSADNNTISTNGSGEQTHVARNNWNTTTASSEQTHKTRNNPNASTPAVSNLSPNLTQTSEAVELKIDKTKSSTKGNKTTLISHVTDQNTGEEKTFDETKNYNSKDLIGISETSNSNKTDANGNYTKDVDEDKLDYTLDDMEQDIPDLVHDPTGFLRLDYRDPDFNLTKLKDFQTEHENTFKTFPDYQNTSKILAYRCRIRCGGWADRLKGIVEVYMLSLLAKRRFAILMKEPSDLENFLTPNILDWRLSEDDIKNATTKGEVDNKKLHDAMAVKYELADIDPEKIFKEDIVYVIANQDWTRSLRKLSVSPVRFPQLYQYPSSDLTSIIYHGLFKPSKKLKELLDAFLEVNINGKKLACLHARMGEKAYQRYTFKQIQTPLNFLKEHFSNDDYNIMVATDTPAIKAYSKAIFPNFVDTTFDGALRHIDYMWNSTNNVSNSDSKENAFMRSMLDHAILSRCDTLVLTESGFGFTAAMLRHTSHNLYVYVKNAAGSRKVVPARRELIRELFQYNCLAQITGSTYICDS